MGLVKIILKLLLAALIILIVFALISALLNKFINNETVKVTEIKAPRFSIGNIDFVNGTGVTIITEIKQEDDKNEVENK